MSEDKWNDAITKLKDDAYCSSVPKNVVDVASGAFKVFLIPVVPDVLDTVSTLMGDRAQTKSNEAMSNCLETMHQTLTPIVDKARKSEPTYANLVDLTNAVLGERYANALINRELTAVNVLLHPSTVTEFEPFVTAGLMTLVCTNKICSMGSQNKIAGCIEEIKRPFGQGTSFSIKFA